MLKKESIFLIIVFLTLGVNSCQGQPQGSTAVNNKTRENKTPYEVVNAFFQAAKNSESLEEFERVYPERFSECLLKTPLECSQKRQETQKAKPSTQNSLPRFEESPKSELSIFVKNYPKKIASNSIILKRKISEWIKDDECRIRVELEIDGLREVKDFLLFKDEKWKIFEIAREGDYIFFAPPSNDNQIAL